MKRCLPLLLLLSALELRGQTLLDAPGLAAFSRHTTYLQVDTFLDFHAQTIGGAYDTNLIQSDVWGNAGNWSVTSDGTINPQIFTNVAVPSFTLDTPIQTPDGSVFKATPPLGLREDLAGGVNGSTILEYTWPGASLVSATFWLMFTNISAPTQNSRDFYLWFGNPYAVAQFNIYDANPNNLQVRSGLHSAISNAFPSAVSGIPTNMWIKGELVEEMANGMAFVTYRNATNNALIFSSVVYGDPNADLQTLFKLNGGYIYVPTISGYSFRGPTILALSNNVPTNRPPWIPNAPSSITKSQVGDGQVNVGWTDNNFMLNSNLVHLSNSLSGDVTAWASPADNNITVSGLTAGQTYDIRVESFFINGVKSTFTSGGTITPASSTWYDSMTITDTNSAVDQNFSFENYAVPVTVASGGTCTKIRLGINTINNGGSPISMKLAVFDGSKNLVSSLTTLTGTTPGLIEFSMTPFSVSAGTYYIGFNSFCNPGIVIYWSKSGTSGTEIHAGNTGFDYTQYPPSNLGSADIGTTQTIAAGMLVQ